MRPIIEADQLSCFYGIVLGLNNVSFATQPGITGLVGPNGAGKSTLIKLVTGQMAPSSGSIKVLGQSPYRNTDILARIGYCPEREQVRKDLKPVDWLTGLAALANIDWKQGKVLAESALRRVNLQERHWTKRVGNLSKGMKQRVKLAQSIMLDPDLIVLDEPMNGLDPDGRNEFAEILRDIASQGKSILVSSHILHELESICNRFLILNWGRLLASGTQIEIREESASWTDEVSIRCDDPGRLAARFQNKGVIKGYLVEEDTLHLWLRDPDEFFKSWTALVADSEVAIFDVRNRNQALANLFENMIA